MICTSLFLVSFLHIDERIRRIEGKGIQHALGFPKIVEERKPFVCCKMLGFLEALSISSAGAFCSFVCLFKRKKEKSRTLAAIWWSVFGHFFTFGFFPFTRN